MGFNTETAAILKHQCFSVDSVKAVQDICGASLNSPKCSVFEFARVYDNGEALILYSNPSVSKYIIENQVHITAHVPPSILDERFWYLPIPGHYSKVCRDIKEIAGVSGFIDYIERFPGYFDMYCFWSIYEQPLSANYFLNTRDQLEQFCYQFRNKATKLINKTEKDKFLLPRTMATNFQGLDDNTNTCNNLPQIEFYLQKAQRELSKLVAAKLAKLTAKEKEIIGHLMLGRTASDIANLIGLSTRTVEMHLDTTRVKLGCRKKSQIIDALIRLSHKCE